MPAGGKKDSAEKKNVDEPKVFVILHDLGKHGTPQEDRVLPVRRILDTRLEFLRNRK